MIKQIYRFFRRNCAVFAVLLAVFLSQSVVAEKPSTNYGDHPKALLFVDKMVEQHGFDRAYVQNLMGDAQKKQKILDAIARPAEKTKQWRQYRKIFLTEQRTSLGKVFLRDNAAALARAERDFGVPKEIITAIIGVETQYGKFKGKWRVVDALATLGFDYPPRGKFFSRQLEEYLLLVREQKLDAKAVKGSYAGAIGYGQFIPSSYRGYAIDFDGDGIADIVDNITDAIGSVANYFKSHGWRPGELISSRAEVLKNYNSSLANGKLKPKYTVGQLREQGYKPLLDVSDDAMATPLRLMGELGEEHWLGLQNFYVITRYNHSRLYAMAVFQLSETLK